MSVRAVNVARCQELRGRGLLYREIAAATGLAYSTVSEYIRDPSGGRVAARKESYRGTCSECGAWTFGGNGRAAAPSVCAACAPGVYGPVYAARKRGVGTVASRALVLLGRGDMRAMDLAKALGITQIHVGVLMGRMLRYGLAVRVSRGVYRATSEGVGRLPRTASARPVDPGVGYRNPEGVTAA